MENIRTSPPPFKSLEFRDFMQLEPSVIAWIFESPLVASSMVSASCVHIENCNNFEERT